MTWLNKISVGYILLHLVLASACTKQEPSSIQKDVFFKTFGGSYQDELTDVIEVENNFFVLGNIKDAENNTTLQVIRTDEFGNKIWQKNFNPDQKQTVGNQIIKLKNNNQFAIIGGVKNNADLLYFDIYLLIIEGDGTVLNEVIYEMPSRNQIGKCISELEPSGFVIGATSALNISNTIDSILYFPVTASGNLKLPYMPGIKGTDLSRLTKKNETGGFMLTGKDNNNKPLVIVLQPDGTKKSTIKIDIEGTLNGITQSNDGTTYLCGTLSNGPNGYTDGFIAAYKDIEETVDYIYMKEYGYSRSDNFTDLVITSDNKLLVTGSTEDLVLGTTNIWVCKIGITGELLSQIQIGGDNNEKGARVLESTGNSFVTGGTISFGKSSMMGIIKSNFE